MSVRGTYLDMPVSIDDLDGENLEYFRIARNMISICSDAMIANCCAIHRPRHVHGVLA